MCESGRARDALDDAGDAGDGAAAPALDGGSRAHRHGSRPSRNRRGSRARSAVPRFGIARKSGAAADSSHGVDDAVIATKIRLLTEGETRPAFGIRFATKLPNASNASGLDLNTTDFFISLLGAKTVQSIRVVGNLGVGILSDPTDGARQNDDLTYGLSLARAVTQQAELVGELNGRVSTRSGTAFPGTETRGLLRLGGRYTVGMLRLDAGLFFGLTTVDPTVGFTAGLTYVFNGFKVP
jgi:hypothetical protein